MRTIVRLGLVAAMFLASVPSLAAAPTGSSPRGEGASFLGADQGKLPGLTTVVILGAVPAAYFSIAAIAQGPGRVRAEHRWVSLVGTLSAAAITAAGIAHGVANWGAPAYLALPSLITGVGLGVPALVLATYGFFRPWAAPRATVTILARAGDGWRVGLPIPVVIASRDGGVAVGVTLAAGTF